MAQDTRHFAEEIAQLKQRLLLMGGLAEERVSLAMRALVERDRDLAVNIAEAADRYVSHVPVKPLVDLPRMGDIAQQMLRDALDAFVSRDSKAAQAVLNQDDALDALKIQVFREL